MVRWVEGTVGAHGTERQAREDLRVDAQAQLAVAAAKTREVERLAPGPQ